MIIIYWYSTHKNRWYTNKFPSENKAYRRRIHFLEMNLVQFKIEKKDE